MIAGMGSYIAIHFYNQSHPALFGVHTVTVPVFLSLVAFILFSLLTKGEAYQFPEKNIHKV